MSAHLRDIVTELVAAGLSLRQRRRVIEDMRRPRESIGEAAFWALPSDRDDTRLHDLDGWPQCQCTACGCTELATTTDDCDIPTCAACAEYTTDDDGEIHCSRCDDTEVVVESCGAGGQTRTYIRIRPPEMPPADPHGQSLGCVSAHPPCRGR
jgi:hypothetical protein